MKNRPPETFSREAFERLTHPEKLEYLTYLMDALERSRASGTNAVRAASTPPGRRPARLRTRSDP